MRFAPFVVAIAVSGCGFSLELGSSPTDGGGDGGSGSDGDTGDAPHPFGCYGTGLVVVCPLTQPVPTFEVTVATTLDTNVSSNCAPVNGTNVIGTCAILAENITIMAEVRVIGPRPLVLVGTKTIEVSGSLDASSRSGSKGAGVSTTVCTNGQGPGTVAGGAGGSFGGRGGSGGNDDGGKPGLAIVPTSLRGGCRGQSGSGNNSGGGGYGGGGIYLIAGAAISISGRINASGEGGGGGGAGGVTISGGGGGGSGGMIVFDAPSILIASEVFASGGGGGGGSSVVANGGRGDDPASVQAMPGGGDGAGLGEDGNGGGGTLDEVVDGNGGHGGTFAVIGGGGGGGGAGYIKAYGTVQNTGRIAPPLVP